MPKISVLIVNFNAGDRLRRCLDCLARQTFQDFETIVIDNASSDDSLARAKESALDFRLIEAGANVGFAAGNNRAAREATGEWLAFLNPDAYAAADWLENLMAGADRYPWADAFGSAQLDAADPTKIDGAGDAFHILGVPYRSLCGRPADRLPAADEECFAPCAAAALYRRAAFEALGGFDERFFCYSEDVDLGFRLRLAGGRCVQLSGARVLHEGSGIAGRHSEFAMYHGHRNRIWTLYKNMPAALYWPLSPLHLAVNLLLFPRFFSLGLGRVYWRALLDGYGGLSRFSADRRLIQAGRKVSDAALMGMFVWSPLKLVRREGPDKPAPAAPETASPVA